MTYSDNLEKLRQAGVIDMTLSFGCKFLGLCGYDNDIVECTFVSNKLTGYEDGYEYINHIGEPVVIKGKFDREILGHPITIGRVLRWIENRPHVKKSIGREFIEGPKKRMYNILEIISLRHNKDLPLDDQENREEIAEFLVSFIK